MKKSVLILCFALFTLNSCSKNDDNLMTIIMLSFPHLLLYTIQIESNSC